MEKQGWAWPCRHFPWEGTGWETRSQNGLDCTLHLHLGCPFLSCAEKEQPLPWVSRSEGLISRSWGTITHTDSSTLCFERHLLKSPLMTFLGLCFCLFRWGEGRETGRVQACLKAQPPSRLYQASRMPSAEIAAHLSDWPRPEPAARLSCLSLAKDRDTRASTQAG